MDIAGSQLCWKPCVRPWWKGGVVGRSRIAKVNSELSENQFLIISSHIPDTLQWRWKKPWWNDALTQHLQIKVGRMNEKPTFITDSAYCEEVISGSKGSNKTCSWSATASPSWPDGRQCTLSRAPDRKNAGISKSKSTQKDWGVAIIRKITTE